MQRWKLRHCYGAGPTGALCSATFLGAVEPVHVTIAQLVVRLDVLCSLMLPVLGGEDRIGLRTASRFGLRH
jgi:hypothetical protein